MSYDVGLYINTGSEDYQVVDIGNYTYNVSPMFYKAFGEKGLNTIHEMQAKDAIPLLRKAIDYMLDNDKELKTLNPINGWGDYKGALNFLRDIMRECENHSLCIIRIE